MNILKINRDFGTQEKCIKQLEKVRWNGTPICPYCKSNKSSKGKGRYYTCLNFKCKNGFSVTVGTLFHDTKVPLQKWFLAISLILDAKKGVSALQLQRNLEIGSYITAWRMLRLIRTAMGEVEMSKYFKGIVEMDETYVGKKPKRNSGSKRGRGTDKTPIVGIVDREEKKYFAQIALPNEEGKKISGKQLLEILDKVTGKKSVTVMTDEFTSYNILKKEKRYTHKVINHSKEFVNGDIHTNNIENFWLQFKRGLYGVYHSMSKKYLQQYINEFCFRYNNRNEAAAFDLLLQRALLIKSC
jgi:transposase-like protein